MYKISNIISSPIISLYEGENLGIIYNILFDCKSKKCKYACILNEIENVEKSLDISNIYTVGNDCIFVKNSSYVELECNNDRLLCNCISALNLDVYNLSGQLVGTCIDIEIDSKFYISKLILNNEITISASNIINLGKSVIIISDKSINISKFKPKLRTLSDSNNEDKVYILNNVADTSPQLIHTSTSNKIITDGSFLKNRILTQDIIALNGELIAKRGTVITANTIATASMYGKLAELARYSQQKKSPRNF